MKDTQYDICKTNRLSRSVLICGQKFIDIDLESEEHITEAIVVLGAAAVCPISDCLSK